MVGTNCGLYAYVRKKGRANNVVDGGFRNNVGIQRGIYGFKESGILMK